MLTEKFKLEYPVEEEGLSELQIRYPAVSDLILAKKVSGGDEEKLTVTLLSNLSMITPDQVYKLDMSDFTEVMKVLKGMMDTQKHKVDQTKAKHRSVEIDLIMPIEVDGKTRTKLTIKRPSVGDVKHAESFDDDFISSIRLMARVTGLSDADAEKLELATDYGRVRDYISLFLGVSRQRTEAAS